MVDLKTFISYVDQAYFSSNPTQDFFATNNAVDLFFDFYKNNEFPAELVSLLKKVHERIQDDSEKEPIDPAFLSLFIGTFIGFSLGKFSTRVTINNSEL